jgi:hypothetical protein
VGRQGLINYDYRNSRRAHHLGDDDVDDDGDGDDEASADAQGEKP